MYLIKAKLFIYKIVPVLNWIQIHKILITNYKLSGCNHSCSAICQICFTFFQKPKNCLCKILFWFFHKKSDDMARNEESPSKTFSLKWHLEGIYFLNQSVVSIVVHSSLLLSSPSKDGQTDVSTEVKSLVALLNYLDNIQREGGCSNNTFFSIQMVQLSKTTFHSEMGKPLCTTLNLFLGGLGCR